MKFKYLGTGAAERVPAIFCNCSICRNAQLKKGREIRTQAQAVLDDGQILLDFPGDSYLHKLTEGINFNEIEHLLITHWHSDHFYGEDLAYRMSEYGQNLSKKLTIYGSVFVKQFFDRALNLEKMNEPDRLEFQVVKPYQKFLISQL
ncbi:hypothetical protein PT285_02560 [Lactobacillus sp. ESL0791]|uniref:hypothetical protein n=1 Tax=Lactobacillus sp. ESL0791 TaxID=2983234 RepID=UPI0023F86D8C|nr:hypothetical protein [Lactobacillus sp. ESL0791]MDF7638316.1 hypothetical protein [Lactobacillus sp. ESL0791]